MLDGGFSWNYLTFLVFISQFSKAFAAPPNDDPCNAISLPVTASCVYATYTNVAATATPGQTTPNCSSYLGGDIWFSIVVPASGALLL